MTQIPLHVSGVQLYWECRRKWYYGSKHWGLGYSSPYQQNDKMLLGTWVHYALALVYRWFSYDQAAAHTMGRQAEMDNLYGEWSGDAGKLRDTFHAIMNMHQAWQASDTSWYSDRNLDWVYPEYPFSVEIEGVLLEGIIDGVVRHKITGEFYLFERKTSTNPNKIEQGVLHDLQPRAYLAIAEKLFNAAPTGIIYELIKSTNVSDIKLLRNGMPSKAVTELGNTTYEVYADLLKRCVLEKGGSWVAAQSDYAAQLDWLKQNPDPILRRTLHVFNPAARKSGLTMMLRTYTEMQAQRELGQDVIPTGLNRHHCGYCQFRDVCSAHDDGADWQTMLSTMYIKDAVRFDDTLEA